MQTLAEYLDQHAAKRGDRQAFARRVEISPSYLSEISSGLKRPSLTVAFRIERETGGAVPATSFLGREAAA